MFKLSVSFPPYLHRNADGLRNHAHGNCAATHDDATTHDNAATHDGAATHDDGSAVNGHASAGKKIRVR